MLKRLFFKRLAGIALAVTTIVALSGFESAPSIIFVSNTYSGHEEITRQAINNVMAHFENLGIKSLFVEQDIFSDLEAREKGIHGDRSKNMIIQGNFATDFPERTKTLSLENFWSNEEILQSEGASSQVFHFLRNYRNSLTLEGAQQTCRDAREVILVATHAAVEAWINNQPTKALFLIGHATHTIQDSFSTAHTRRKSSAENNDLTNICFYGSSMRAKFDLFSKKIKYDLCYHENLSNHDSIWNSSDKQQQLAQEEWPDEESIRCDKNILYPKNDAEKKSCMKHEARLARIATEKYLYLVFAHLNMLQTNPANSKSFPEFMESLTTRLFEGPVGQPWLDQKMANGIMRCDGLSTSTVIGEEPITTSNTGNN